MEESEEVVMQAEPEASSSPVYDGHPHELVDTALAAIDTLLNMSMWVIAILAFLLAVIGIFGWSAIKNACVSKAEKMAEEKLEIYLASDEFAGLLEDKVQEAIERKWQGGLFINVDSAKPSGGAENPFPEPKKATPAVAPKPAKGAPKTRKK